MPDTAITAERIFHLASPRRSYGPFTAATVDPNNDPNVPGGGGPGVNPLLGEDLYGYTEVVWDLTIASGTPTYTWVTYRYIEAANRWTPQDTAAAATTDTSVEQTCAGDRVFLRLSAVSGGGVRISCRGINRNRR